MSKKRKRLAAKSLKPVSSWLQTGKILCRCKRHYKSIILISGLLVIVGGVAGYLESIHVILCIGVEETVRHLLVTFVEDEI